MPRRVRLMGSGSIRSRTPTPKFPWKRLFSTFGVSSAAVVGACRWVRSESQPGIDALDRGELNRVIDSSVRWVDELISSFGHDTTAVAGNKLVFKADFTDGSSGIYTDRCFRRGVPGDVNNDGQGGCRRLRDRAEKPRPRPADCHWETSTATDDRLPGFPGAGTKLRTQRIF